MKVQSINNAPFYGAKIPAERQGQKNTQTNNTTNVMCPVCNVLQDKNYGVLQTKKMNVSFTGAIPTKPINEVSKKVNNLFNIVKSNDLILTAPSYKEAVEALKENVDNIKTVIKRVFFIEEKSLDRTIGFRKNLGDKETINLSTEPLIIKDKKNQTGFLKQGEIGYLQDGDTVNFGKHGIDIREQEETILPIKNSFTFFVDLDKEVEPKIKEINEKSLSMMNVEKTETKPKEHKIMFSDVGGMDGTIKELKKNILFPMKHPEITNGKNMRKQVLLYGPPGTGKSFVAEACANEAGAWFRKINASELDSKWVGESEENWRNLFTEARKNQPALIFIDEIDAIAKKRTGQDPYGEKTLNTILGLMSDSEKRGDQIYMIAATNKRSMLDEAATRSGRFGLAIEAPAPDLKGTEAIFDIYTRNEPLAKELDKETVIGKLFKEKATGADIAAASEDARNSAMERAKIYEKIEEGTYTPEDLKNVKITNEDFDIAIETLKKNKLTQERRPIGFLSELYKK